MRLRNQLVLFFGTLVTLMAMVLVLLTEHQTQTRLLSDVKDKLSRGRYAEQEKHALQMLMLLGDSIQRDGTINGYATVFSAAKGPAYHLEQKTAFGELLRELGQGRPNDDLPWTKPEAEESASSDVKQRFEAWTALTGLAWDQLQTVVEPVDDVDLVGFSDRRNRLFLLLTTDPKRKLPPADTPIAPPPEFPQLTALLEGAAGEPVWSYLLHPTDKNVYLTYVRPLGRGGSAVLGTRLDAERLAEFSGLSGLEIALERSGQPVLSNMADAGAAAGLQGRTPPPSGEVVSWELAGQKYFVSARSLNGPDKKPVANLYELRSLSWVQAYLEKMTGGIATVGIVCLVLAILGIGTLSRRVTTPIEQLSRKMSWVGEGDLSQNMEAVGAFEIVQAANSFNQMVQHLRQKEMLAKMVPKQAREAIAKEEVVGGRVAGRRLKTTVLFSDIRGFTSLSEKLSPAEVMGLLDIYLARMTDVIESLGGDVNEYIGDAILADFEDKDGVKGAARAVKACYEMTRALEDLKKQNVHPHLRDLRQGIGLNTGELVKGEIGATDRSKFALIGDSVNLAARIQDRSRNGQHTCILVSDSTYKEAGAEFEFVLFGEEEFKGKSSKTRVWEIVGPSRSAHSTGGAKPGGDTDSTAGA